MESGSWFNSAYPERIFTPQVGLVSADGKGEIHNLTLSGYDNYMPKWVMDGKMMIWGSDREGTRQQGGDISSGDVYEMFFTKAAFDRFKLSKEEFALAKEQEDKEKKDAEEKKQKMKRKEKNSKTEKDTLKEVVIDWNNLTERKSRLTIYTSEANDWILSKDGEKLYYMTKFDKGNDLWVTELRTKETKILAKLGADAGFHGTFIRREIHFPASRRQTHESGC